MKKNFFRFGKSGENVKLRLLRWHNAELSKFLYKSHCKSLFTSFLIVEVSHFHAINTKKKEN